MAQPNQVQPHGKERSFSKRLSPGLTAQRPMPSATINLTVLRSMDYVGHHSQASVS
jgi:hypothetical protein